MSALDDMLADDFANVFANADMMVGAESFTYTPFGGVARTITGQVTRLGLQDRGGSQPREVVVLEVPNSATLGILASSANFGKDTVTLAPIRGGTSKTLLIHLPSDGQEWADAGMVRCEAW